MSIEKTVQQLIDSGELSESALIDIETDQKKPTTGTKEKNNTLPIVIKDFKFENQWVVEE